MPEYVSPTMVPARISIELDGETHHLDREEAKDLRFELGKALERQKS